MQQRVSSWLMRKGAMTLLILVAGVTLWPSCSGDQPPAAPAHPIEAPEPRPAPEPSPTTPNRKPPPDTIAPGRPSPTPEVPIAPPPAVVVRVPEPPREMSGHPDYGYLDIQARQTEIQDVVQNRPGMPFNHSNQAAGYIQRKGQHNSLRDGLVHVPLSHEFGSVGSSVDKACLLRVR